MMDDPTVNTLEKSHKLTETHSTITHSFIICSQYV